MSKEKCTYIGNVNTINNIKDFFFELSNESRLSNVAFVNTHENRNTDSIIKEGSYDLVDVFNELSSDATAEINSIDNDDLLSDESAHEKEILEEVFVTLRNIADVECMDDCRISFNEHSKVFVKGEYDLSSFIEDMADILEDVFIENYESDNNE